MNTIINILNSSSHCAVMTGAGISTLSGIRDFRGKNGLNTTMNGEKIFDLSLFYSDASYYYKHTRDFIYDLDDKSPNIVHQVLARMEERHIISSIITQNVDLLHQKAGSKNVFEIHGSPSLHHCMTCGKEFTFDWVKNALKHEIVPSCDYCGGVIKPDITFYGEGLPKEAIDGASREAEKCDCFIVLGSSLVVYPASSMPEIALEHGAKLIIVNQQPTHLDPYATAKYDDLEKVFRFLDKHL